MAYRRERFARPRKMARIRVFHLADGCCCSAITIIASNLHTAEDTRTAYKRVYAQTAKQME